MHVHADAFRRIVNVTLGSREQGYRDNATLSSADAGALVGIVYLALDADNREDPDEVAVVDEITQQVAGLAGVQIKPPAERATDDYDRLDEIRKLGLDLSGPRTRDFAYALSYAVTISDLDLAPEETKFLDALAIALGIEDARAAELAAIVAEAVTPLG